MELIQQLHNNTIQNFVKEKLIHTNIAKALITDNPKTARFYLLPKVHKENIPGRSITCHKHPLIYSRICYHQLQPIVQKLKSHIKDTTDFINKSEEIKQVPKGAILYTNIPHIHIFMGNLFHPSIKFDFK